MNNGNILPMGNKNGNGPKQQIVELTEDDLAGQIVCKSDTCECTYFIAAIQFVVISQFSPKNPTGENAIQNLPAAYFCKDCGEPMDPESMIKRTKKEGNNGATNE